MSKFTISPIWKSALLRGIRSFIGAFVVVDPLSNVIGWASGYQPLDISALRAAAVAGLVSVIALGWRVLLDPSPIPSLDDTPALTASRARRAKGA